MMSENFQRIVPEGDDHERQVCGDCGFINYENPKLIVGAVVSYRDQVLLCRRAIEPRKGYWTVPAGFMEMGETCREGAAREALEEANADIEVGDTLGIYTISRISQVQVFFRSELKSPEFSAGIESLEVALFSWDDIPWDEIAFPTAIWALRAWKKSVGKEVVVPDLDSI
jgi:ADP-ribose pyrophosphatase YjhB (NUDIX family)